MAHWLWNVLYICCALILVNKCLLRRTKRQVPSLFFMVEQMRLERSLPLGSVFASGFRTREPRLFSAFVFRVIVERGFMFINFIAHLALKAP